MTPTKFSTISNLELMDKLAELTAKRENGRYYFMDPEEVADTLQEVRNRIERLEHILNNPWIPVEQQLPPMVEDWDFDLASKPVIVLLENGELSKDIYWKNKKIGKGGWSFSSIKVTHWMPFIDPQEGGEK